MKSLIFPLALLCIYSGLSGLTQSAVPLSFTQSSTPTTANCDVKAYVIDPDPKGLNVRSGPGSSYKVIGNLPTQNVDGIGVHITGSNGEWIRINQATQQGGDEDKVLFSGEGWVYGPLLGTDGVGWIPGGTPLYKEPAKKSGLVTRMVAGGEGATVRGCQGKWMYVEHKKMRGWAEGDKLCDNSLTNCN